MKAVINRLRARFGREPIRRQKRQPETHCNFADNYYGDQVCRDASDT